MFFRYTPKNQNGFTLIELLLVLTLVGVLVSKLVPAFNGLILSMRINAAASNIERTLRHARSHALLNHRYIRICPSRNAYWCSNSTDWSEGWITYVDLSGDQSRDAEDTIVATQGAFESIHINYNRGNQLSINPKGRITQSGTIRICSPKLPDGSINLVMTHTARIRLHNERGPCS
ncbi:MAG: GspH/FimT family protein [bacterium]